MKITVFIFFLILLIMFLLIKLNSPQKDAKSMPIGSSNLKDFNQISGPFGFNDKSKAAIIISRVICENVNSSLIDNEKKEKLIVNALTKKGLSPEIRNSYEVTKASQKILEILNNRCEIETSKVIEQELIFKQYFKYNKN